MDELKKIMFDAAVSANKDRMELEMEDFKAIEAGFVEKADPVEDGVTEVWSLSEPEEQPEEGFALGVKLVGVYPDPYVALADDDMIQECKNDGSVGIVLRCTAWTSATAPATGKKPSESDDRYTTHITCLCTSAGVHVLARFNNEVHEMSETKSDAFRSENKLTRAIATACYGW
jgi:hypothetical protein